MNVNKENSEEPFYKYHYGKWIKVGVLKLQNLKDNRRKRIIMEKEQKNIS